jgi:hypothetical protein
MSLKKLYFTLIISVLALATTAYLYYFNWRKEMQLSYEVPCIPQSAALVYQVDAIAKQWDQIQQVSFAKDLTAFPLYTSIQAGLKWLEALGIDHASLEEQPMTISIHRLSEREPGYNFYFPLNSHAAQDLGKKLLQLKNHPNYQVEENQYFKHTITTITQVGHAQAIYVIKQGGYLIASSSSLLLEDIIRGVVQKDPKAFLSLVPLGHQPGRLYVNFIQLPSLLDIFFKDGISPTWGAFLTYFATAAQLEVKLTNHHLLFNGFTEPLDKAEKHSHRPTAQDIGSLDLLSYIPGSTSWLQHIYFKDAQILTDSWRKHRHAHRLHAGENEPRGMLAESLDNLLNPLLNGELGLCKLGATNQEQILLIKVHHPEAFITALEESNLIQKLAYQLPQRTHKTVYKIAEHTFSKWLPGYLFPDFQPTLLTNLGNYIILATRKTALRNFIQQYNQGNTWANSHQQKAFLENLLDQAHYSLFVHIEKAWPQLMQMLKPQWQTIIAAQKDDLQNFKQTSLQIVPDQHNAHSYYISLVVEHLNETNETKVESANEIPALEHFKADAPIITRPFIVHTHKPESSLVLFQDILNQIYCVDIKGKLLWKNTLKSPMVGNVFVVDFYKNNRYQYLWLTEDAIHLTDYYGRSVGNYPQPLPRPNTPFSLQVIDYRRDKTYRFLLADNTGNLYFRDSHYRPLPGWNPNALGHALASMPLHIRLKNDYFLILQQNGMVRAIGRKKQSFPGFPLDLKATIHNPLVVKKGSTISNTSLVTLTDEGLLSHHSLTGNLQESTQLEKPTNTTQFILCLEEAKKQGYAIVQQDLDKFAFLDESGQLLFAKEYSAAQPLLYQYYDFGTYQFYVVTDQGQEVSYIYNRQGAMIHKSPLNNSHLVHLMLNATNLLVYSSYKDQLMQYLVPLETNSP